MVTLDDPKVRAALDGDELPRMSFGDHLEELRWRLVKALLAIVLVVGAVIPFKDAVQEIIIDPYRVQWRIGFREHIEKLESKEAAAKAANVPLDEFTTRFLAGCRKDRDIILAGEHPYPGIIANDTGFHVPYSLYAMDGLADVMSWMWASLVFALVLASPIVVWQLWAFIGAGLYPHERAVFYRYFPFMLLLIGAGVAFGYFAVLPYSLGFLIRMMNPDQVNAMFGIGQFLTLEFALTGAMGLVFQLPLVMLALQRIGLTPHEWYIKNWRMTILIIFIVAAVVTPPEPVSMLLMAGPMVLLFGLGLLLTRWHRPKVVGVPA